MKTLSAFSELVKDIFGPRLKKVIAFGKQDVLLLFSTLTKEDQVEISQLAEEWSKNEGSPVTPLAMDEKSFKKQLAEGKQLAKDIQKNGIPL